MAVISIVGTTGVGKSFLVQKLASITNSSAFLEGEGGTIPKRILENIANKGNPIERWKFFLARYKSNLEQAMALSKKNQDCFVDGAIFSARAILTYEDKKYQKELSAMIDNLAYLKSDIVLLLIADEEKIKENIIARSRSFEDNKNIIARALKIQKAFISLAQKEDNVIVIDRTNLDFSNTSELKSILNKIEAFKK